tara:strand:+ start:354 stop:524 length:171 start_codon:yes stop_codon:yes gene_type:complete
MKEKLILLLIITIYSTISTPIIKNNIANSINHKENNIEIAIAEDIWDYLSRFRINN